MLFPQLKLVTLWSHGFFLSIEAYNCRNKIYVIFLSFTNSTREIRLKYDDVIVSAPVRQKNKQKKLNQEEWHMYCNPLNLFT